MDGVSLLCVDDDADLVELTAVQLRRAGEQFEVTTETDPRGALETVSNTSIDCVISDYDMPEMDGLEFLEAVREGHPDLPFILFTGKGSEEVASEAIARGVTDYLQKGTGDNQYDLLANRVRNAVEQYRAAERAASLDRIRSILRDVNRSLVRAEDRNAIEHRVCEIIATADPYRQACILAPDGTSDRFDKRVRVGDGTLEETGCDGHDVTELCPAVDAVDRDEIVTVTANRDGTERQRALYEGGYTAAGAIPITYDEREYGALCLIADDDAFDTDERELLAEIGDDLAHAIYRAEIHERLRRNERIITNLPVGVYRNSPLPDGTLLAVNPALVELFDAETPDDLLGRPFRDFYADPADREQFTTALKRDGVVRGMELDLETLAGEQFRASVTGILTDEGGEQYFDGVIRDVTDRRDRERTLSHYETLFELASSGVFRTTADGNLRDTNPWLADQLGCDSPADAIERIDDLGEDLYAEPKRREKLLERLRSDGSIEGVTIDVEDRRGRQRTLSIDATTVGTQNGDGFEIVGWARPVASQEDS